MLTLDVPIQRTPIVSGLLGPPLPVYTSLITLHPPTQHSHCELLKRTSHTFVADLFEVTIGILYSLALKNLPKTIFRYCSLSPSFPLRATAENLSLWLFLQPPHHFAALAFPSLILCNAYCPLFWQLSFSTPSLPGNQGLSHFSYSKQVPQTLLNSIACNSLTLLHYSLRKRPCSAAQRGTQCTCLLPKVLSHSQFSIPFFFFSEVNEIFLSFIWRH